MTLPAIDEQGYRRKLDNTFFTFPEWYIVYSFEDFGRFLDSASESRFNYLGHVLGFWRSFCTINRAMLQTVFPLRSEDDDLRHRHQPSTEYAIKGAYENTIGRVFEWIRGEHARRRTTMPRAVLQDYSAFLYTVPWVKYPFREKLNGLYGDLYADARALHRTMEARLRPRQPNIIVKIGYAALIQKALDACGDNERRDIMFAVATLPPEVLAKEPRIKPVRTLNAGMAVGADAALQGFYRNSCSACSTGHPRCRDRGKSRNLDHRDCARNCNSSARQRRRGTVFTRSRR